MKLTVISGRSGSGKTKKMLELLNKTEDNLVITADPAVVYIEMQMAKNKEKGKCVGIESLAKTLAFDCNMPEMKEAPKELQMIILSAIILEHNILSQTRMDSSAVNRVYAFLHELDEQNIPPAQFDAVKTEVPTFLQGKTEEISLVYEKFMDEIHKKGYFTKEDILRNVSKNMPEKLPYKHVYVDVLDRYNPNMMILFHNILKSAEDMTMVFNTTSPKAYDFEIHQESMNAMINMYEFVDSLDYCVCERIENKSIRNNDNAISIIEKELFNQDTTTKSNAENIMLHEASTLYKEIDFVTSQILALVKNGAKYSDIIVSGTSLDRYIGIIESSFRNNKIPFYYYKNTALTKSVFYEYIDTVFDIMLNGISASSFLSLVYLNFHGFTQEELSTADTFFKRFGDDFDIAMANGKKYDPSGFIIVQTMVRKVMSNIYKIDDSSKTIHDFLISFYAYLESSNIMQTLEEKAVEAQKEGFIHASKELVNTWNHIIGIFNLLDESAGSEPFELLAVRNVIKRMASDKMSHNTDLYHSQVAVLDMDNAQNRKSKYLFAIGCNEGYMPKTLSTPVFSDRDKNILNEHLEGKLRLSGALETYARTAVFKTLTLPQEKLYITWSSNDIDFTPLRHASIISNIVKTFDENIAGEKQFYAEDKEEAFLNLLKCLSEEKYDGKAKIDKEEFAYFASSSQYGERLKRAVNQLMLESKEFHLANIKEAYKETEYFGITRLETYHECPMKHFIRYALVPKGKKLFEESSSDKGNYFHVSYRNFFERCKNTGVNLSAMDEDTFEKMIQEVFDDIDKGHNENIFNTTAKYQYMAEVMRNRTKVSLWNAIKQISGGSYQVYANEYGIGKNIPLDLEVDGVVYHIIGTIDRVDVCGDNYRIIDYKSGNVDFSKDKLEQGIQLQLPLYAKAMENEDNASRVSGMYYFKIKDIVRDADAVTSLLREYRLSGPTLGADDIIQDNDNALKAGDSSEIIPVELTMKGEVSKRSKVISSEEMCQILELAEEKAKEAIMGIVNGNTKAYPLQTKDYNACEYCPYKAICNINVKNAKEIRKE